MTTKKRGKGGRVSKLTPEMQEEICEHIRQGNYLETSAALAGINSSTIFDWLKRGRREGERLAINPHTEPDEVELPYFLFSRAVKIAQAAAEKRDLDRIDKAADEHWQAAAWRLERRNYKRWGRRQLLEHSGPDGGAVEVQVIKIGDKEIKF